MSSNDPIISESIHKLEQGYVANELISGDQTGKKWSVALLTIYDSPRHVHTIEREFFIVVDGLLAVELGATRSIVNVGESIDIYPGTIHKLTSATDKPVQVLCISFPAFDPNDMHCLE